MNAINMPGFSAEASIYKTSEHYQVAGIMAQFVADASRILPALRSSCVCPCKILHCPDTGPCEVLSC